MKIIIFAAIVFTMYANSIAMANEDKCRNSIYGYLRKLPTGDLVYSASYQGNYKGNCNLIEGGAVYIAKSSSDFHLIQKKFGKIQRVNDFIPATDAMDDWVTKCILKLSSEQYSKMKINCLK